MFSSTVSARSSAGFDTFHCNHKNYSNSRSTRQHQPRTASGGSKRITINVSGRKFETWDCTLLRFPNTLLGSAMKQQFYDATRNEYFLDRDPHLFKFVLNYYRSGKLHCSPEDCPLAFEEELRFYGFSIYDVEDCCSELCNARDKPILLEDDDNDFLEGETIPCQGDNFDRHCNSKITLRQKIWLTIGPSKTTRTGVIFHIIYGFFIFLSVLTTTCETLQCRDQQTCGDLYRTLFFTIDSICVIIFTAELLVRFCVCPKKKKFYQDVMNVIDTIAILPYYITLLLESFGVESNFLQILKVLRVLRILKLTRNSRRLRCLLLTLRRCAVDIVFLYCICFLAIILFGTAIYYLEKAENKNDFASIPESFWYICVTLMTIGWVQTTPSESLHKKSNPLRHLKRF